jgi:uncharacterized protein (DUF2126 family)
VPQKNVKLFFMKMGRHYAGRNDGNLKGDVRLTMGGEPTFVSIDDFEGAEWNTAADGPLKRKLADLAPFKTAICSRSFIHFGQGKWYPGELFPR